MSSAVPTPVLLRPWRPLVLWPGEIMSAQDPDAGIQRLLMRHELVHLRRGDAYWDLLALTLRCVFWPSPFVHCAYPCFRDDQEAACDARVVADLDAASRRRYARVLLRLALRPRPAAGFPLSHSGKILKERAMLSIHPPKPRAAGFAVVGLTLFTAAVFALPHGQANGSHEAPEPIHKAPPAYPKQAAIDEIEGYVELRVTVAGDGRVSEVSVADASPDGVFEQAASEAMRQWRFEAPGTPVEVTQRIQFKLD